MRSKFLLPLVAGFCAASLLLSSCASSTAVSADGPGGGKWRDSDIAGSVRASDQIRLQDDFAAAANKDLIADAGPGTGSFAEVQLETMNRKLEILAQDYEDHDGQELIQYYELAAGWDKRNQEGVEPLRPYLDAIAEISSLDDLTQYQCDPRKNPLKLGLLLPRETAPSFADPTRYAMTIAPPPLMLGTEEEYFNLDTAGLEQQEYVRRVAGHIFSALGYEDASIRDLLKRNYRFEKKIAGAQVNMADEDYKSILLTFDECISAAGDYPLERILDAWRVPREGGFFMNTEQTGNLVSLYSEDNLDDIKAMMMVHLAVKSAGLLDRKTRDLSIEAAKSRVEEGYDAAPPGGREEEAILLDYIRTSPLEPILDRIYIEQYAADLDKAGLEQLTEEIISTFRGLFQEETWLSEEGKKKCIEKLDALKVHVVEPDFDMVDYAGLEIRSREEGGTFLEAAFEAERFLADHNASRLTLPCDRAKWDPLFVSTTEVNSVYMPTANGIFIFAGILQEPIYSPSMTLEEKLAGIGTVIGHEITHGFDNSGSQYNKDGLEEDWMPFEDQMAFSDQCSKVSSYYSTIFPFAGSGAYDGNRVTGEATADMGGLRVTLTIGAKHPDFNYDAYFRQYARMWQTTTSIENERILFSMDEHPLAFLRINVGLQQFEEFHKAYGIREGDGMYLPEESRIAVW